MPSKKWQYSHVAAFFLIYICSRGLSTNWNNIRIKTELLYDMDEIKCANATIFHLFYYLCAGWFFINKIC